jgi:hypothetical protein
MQKPCHQSAAGIAGQKTHKKNGTGCYARAHQQNASKAARAIPFHQAKAAAASNHNRWHVKRGRKHPFCELCQGKRFHPEVDILADKYDKQIRHRTIAVENCRCQGCCSARRREYQHAHRSQSGRRRHSKSLKA